MESIDLRPIIEKVSTKTAAFAIFGAAMLVIVFAVGYNMVAALRGKTSYRHVDVNKGVSRRDYAIDIGSVEPTAQAHGGECAPLIP